jgi:hypothetical protein
VLAARRPEADVRDILVTDGDEALRAKLEEFVTQGASKFVVVPAVPPADWGDELGRLYESVVRPLES